MPSVVFGIVGTFALSLVVASRFIRLPCHGHGRPFGRHSWPWAWLVMVATAVVSTGVGLLIAAASREMLAALAGVLVPGGLALITLPPQARTVLTFPLHRLYDRMGDDLRDWCDIRLDAAKRKPRWIADAVEYYFLQVNSGLSDIKTRNELNGWRNSIADKIHIVEQISEDTTPAQLRILLYKHLSIRGRAPEDEPLRVARRLESDALSELELFLAAIYRLGYHKLLIYPYRPSIHRTPAGRA